MKNNQLKLSDFGLATYVDEGRTLKETCGTEEYLAPEVVLNLGYSLPVDIWSAGVLFYELITGELPFVQVKDQVICQMDRSETYVWTHPDVQWLIVDMLEHEQKHRPNPVGVACRLRQLTKQFATKSEKHSFLQVLDDLSSITL